MDNEEASGIIFLATCLHPRSRGNVVVVSGDPRVHPVIQPNYLSHPYDMSCMKDGERSFNSYSF